MLDLSFLEAALEKNLKKTHIVCFMHVAVLYVYSDKIYLLTSS